MRSPIPTLHASRLQTSTGGIALLTSARLLIKSSRQFPKHRPSPSIVAETEGRIMNRVGVLMALLVIAALIAAGLAVASMMLATVLERRAEIGLFKALGATDGRVTAVFS